MGHIMMQLQHQPAGANFLNQTIQTLTTWLKREHRPEQFVVGLTDWSVKLHQSIMLVFFFSVHHAKAMYTFKDEGQEIGLNCTITCSAGWDLDWALGDRFHNCSVILFQPCRGGEKKVKCWAAQTNTFLFHNLKGQVSVKVDRSIREEEREQEDRRWGGRGYMTDNQVDRKRERTSYHKDRYTCNEHKIREADRQRDKPTHQTTLGTVPKCHKT